MIYYASLRPIEDALKEIVKNDGEKIEWFQSQLSTLQAENERLRELPLEILNNHLALVKKVSDRVYGTKEKYEIEITIIEDLIKCIKAALKE